MEIEISITRARMLARKRARREVRGALADTADIILDEYLKQVEEEFDAATQRGELLDFTPRIPSPKELLGVAAALVLGDGDQK